MSESPDPALNADEWDDLQCGFMGSPGHDDAWQNDAKENVQLIAFCNARLPDDSPHKFTQQDVVFLRASAEDVHVTYENYAKLRSLADKLAALLPPE